MLRRILIILMLSFPIFLILGNFQNAHSQVSAKVKYKVKMLKKPNVDSYPVQTLRKGDVLYLIHRDNFWIKAKTKGGTVGYVSSKWIDIRENQLKSLPVITREINENFQDIYKGKYAFLENDLEHGMPLYKSPLGDIICEIGVGLPLLILETHPTKRDHVFVETYLNNQKVNGWIKIDYIEISENANIKFVEMIEKFELPPSKHLQNTKISVSTKYPSKILKNPSKDAKNIIIDTVGMGASLSAISKYGNWLKVKTKSGMIGYISKLGVNISLQEWNILFDEETGKYDQKAIAKFSRKIERKKTSARIRYNVNMYENSSVKSETAEQLKKGALVKLLYREGSWVNVKSQSRKTGYVSKNWINISDENFASLPTEIQYSEIKNSTDEIELVGKYGFLDDEVKDEMPYYTHAGKFGTWAGSIKKDVPFLILKMQDSEEKYVYIETFEDNSKVRGWIQIEYLDIYPEAQVEFEKISKSIEDAKREKIQNLLGILKKIPASDYKKNIEYYSKLIAIEPNERRYHEKLKYYENKLRDRNQALKDKERREKEEKYNTKVVSKAAAGYILEIRSFSWGNEHGYAIAKGQIRNIANKRLKNVVAVVTWYNSDRQFIRGCSEFCVSPIKS